MKGSIVSSTIIVAIIVISSKALGFLRDALIAAYFGATYQTDAFFFASSMPGVPALCMSISTAFLPAYVARLSQNKNRLENDEYASKLLNASVLLAIGTSLIFIVFSPIVVKILAPGFDTQTRKLAILLTRIIMCTFPLLMAQYMMGAILNANKSFGKPQMSGIILNVVYIVFIIFCTSLLGIYALIVGAVCGSICQVLFLAIISRGKYSYQLHFSLDNDVKDLMKKAVPVLLGNAIIQIHEIVDQLVGSMLKTGSISVLSYGATLKGIVQMTIVTSLSSVYYPYISEAVYNEDNEKLVSFINKTFSVMILVLIPITIITMAESRDIVSIVYERGKFNPDTAEVTAMVLLCYAIGFVFNGIREISSKTLYAMNQMTIVTINGAIAVGINIALSLLFAFSFGVIGIALATAIADIVAAVLLLTTLHKKLEKLNFKILFICIKKLIAPSILLLIFCVILKSFFRYLAPFFRFTVITVLGFILYVAVLRLERSDEIIWLEKKLSKKISDKVKN